MCGGGPYIGLLIMGGGEKNLGLGPTIMGRLGIITGGLPGGPLTRGPGMTIGGGTGPPRPEIVGCGGRCGIGRGVLEGPMSE
jgi:hypothetical protein